MYRMKQDFENYIEKFTKENTPPPGRFEKRSIGGP